MKILDLFAGIGGEQRREKIEARGHELITLDMNPEFMCDITENILSMSARAHILKLAPYDFIWASPPCEAFSVASIGHHWGGGIRQYQPKTEHAILSQRIVEKTLYFIRMLNPTKGWLMENPRGVLRKLPCVQGLPRVTVTYCQYGDTRMKPTDLWGEVRGWHPRPMCKNGMSCHERAPRGAKTGTQGIKGSADRAIVPWALWEEILSILEREEPHGR